MRFISHESTSELPTMNNTNQQNSSLSIDSKTSPIFYSWHSIVEAVIIGFVCFVGLIGNVVVIRAVFKAKRFPRQNVYLFFGLSLSDYFTCFVQGPCLIYIIFHTAESPDEVCEVWVASFVPVVIAIFTNTIIALERHMIIYNFQRYLKLFTRKRTLFMEVIVWVGVTSLYIIFYQGLLFRARFPDGKKSCALETNLFNLDQAASLIFRSLAVTVLGLAPIVVQGVCYVSVVIKVYKAELLKHENIDETLVYTRITHIAFARVLVTITCHFPILICFAIGPLFPEVYYTNVHYLNNLVILNSAVSPWISLHDTDFKETFVSWSWRYCTGGKRQGSKRGSRKSQIITSADMKTFGLSLK